MNTSDELTMHFWAMKASIKALKQALTPEQLDIYHASIEESKRKFAELHPDISQEFQERIDALLP